MVLEEVRHILREIFDEPRLEVDERTGPADVPGWDSIEHVKILLAVQEHFGIELAPDEISEVKSVGDLCRAVERHRSGGRR